MKSNYLLKQLNHLTPRTAIEREQKQFIKIAFAVHLSAAISAERYRSDSGALKSAVLTLVYFYIIMIVHKCQQSAAQRCSRTFELRVLPFGKTSGAKLLNFISCHLSEVFPLTVGSGKTMAFENRRGKYKELGKKVPQAYRVYVEDTFLPCDAVIARIFSKEMTHTDNQCDNEEQKVKRYYYHSDHLGSAQFVTDWKGRQYEHIEYTPYGELWIEEVAAGLDKLPFRFTGKELDEETGLYYYGARYLGPKYSRWLSGDPALGEYIPSPGTEPSKLAGMGGIYNTINLHIYHYAGNNPIKYIDPDGRTDRYMDDGIFIAHIDDDIDGVEIFTYKHDNNDKELQSLGYLTNPDGSYISSKHFDELVSAIYSEAQGNDDKENRGMGEVIFNRMNEQQLSLHDTLYHKYSGIDGMKNPKFFIGLSAMENLKKTGILNINGYGENESFINSIIGAIHGMRGYSFITNKAGFYWSHDINRKGPFNKLMTINGCDFFNLTNSGWNLNKRYWP